MNVAKAMRLAQQADNLHAALLRKGKDVELARGHLADARNSLSPEIIEKLLWSVRQTEVREDGRSHDFIGPNTREIKRRQRAIEAADADLRRIQHEYDDLAERWRRARELADSIAGIVGERALKKFAHERHGARGTYPGYSGISAGSGPMV